MSTESERTRGAPPEHHATTEPASTPHPSDPGDSEPPHGDPLRREVVEGGHDEGPPAQGTRHGADPTHGRDAG